MFHRGFEGKYDFDPDEGAYIGSIADVEEFVMFIGTTPEELEINFKKEVDKYIEFLNSRNNI